VVYVYGYGIDDRLVYVAIAYSHGYGIGIGYSISNDIAMWGTPKFGTFLLVRRPRIPPRDTRQKILDQNTQPMIIHFNTLIKKQINQPLK
jgi:hypothetical protein